METLTLNQLSNSPIWFDPATIYVTTTDNNTVEVHWDNKRECFTDEYSEYQFTMDTIYNAPITRIDSKQGCGNTLFVIVKL